MNNMCGLDHVDSLYNLHEELSMAIEERVIESLCGEEGDYNGIWDM